MPIYEYKCQSCAHQVEVFASMSEPPPAACEECGGTELVKVLFPVAVHYKGSGFYATDYGSKKAPAAGVGSGEGSSGGSDAPASSDSTSSSASGNSDSSASGSSSSSDGGSSSTSSPSTSSSGSSSSSSSD